MRPRQPAAIALSLPAVRSCRWSLRPASLFPRIFLHLGTQALAQLGPRQTEGDVGAQESGLRTAIVALAFEFDAVEFLRLRQADHRVGELDFTAGAAFLSLQDLEDLRLQDVAAGDREIRRRGALCWFLHHSVHLEHLAVACADAAYAVLMGEFVGHGFHRN